MIKVYLVLYNFGHVKIFKKKDNAWNFAESVEGRVTWEYATPHEYAKIKFED